MGKRILPNGSADYLCEAGLKASNRVLVIDGASELCSAQFINKLILNLNEEITTSSHEITMCQRDPDCQRHAPKEFFRFYLLSWSCLIPHLPREAFSALLLWVLFSKGLYGNNLSTTTRVYSRWVMSAMRRLRCERYAAWFRCW